MAFKYSLILNKSIAGDVYPVNLVNIGVEINDLHREYNTQVRDKYDPFSFIEWLENVHNVKRWSPSHSIYVRHYDTAYRFYFHAPAYNRRSRIKKVRFAKRNKTIKR